MPCPRVAIIDPANATLAGCNGCMKDVIKLSLAAVAIAVAVSTASAGIVILIAA